MKTDPLPLAGPVLARVAADLRSSAGRVKDAAAESAERAAKPPLDASEHGRTIEARVRQATSRWRAPSGAGGAVLVSRGWVYSRER